MFLDLLDTINSSESYHEKELCQKNALQAESMLYYLLLTGQTPTLSQTQVMDSTIIHAILSNKQSKEHFLKMIQTGNMKVSLYTGNGSRSLQDYFKKSLMYGIDNDTDLFDFSTMPFLIEYDLKTRRTLNKNIIDSIEHNSYNFKTDGVSQEHIEYIGHIIDNIQEIDRAIKGEYLVSNIFKKNIDNLFQIQCKEIIKDKNIDSKFINLCNNMTNKDDYKNRRSIYYNYIERIKGDYSIETVEKMKQIVNNCYNEAVASLVDDNGYSLNFSNKFTDLAQPIEQNGNLIKKEIIEIKESNSQKYLTWETLSNIMMEVEALEKKKKLSRVDALVEYKRTQPYKPIIAVAKYFGVSTLTSFIPGVPAVVEILSDIVSGTVSDIAGEKLKKPSFGEIRSCIENSKNKKQIASNTIKFISMNMK